jgi:hypothetical protein
MIGTQEVKGGCVFFADVMPNEDTNSIRDDISNVASDPDKLRRETEDVVRYYDGEYGGFTDLGVTLNLNALAIGLGLENVEYEPEVFAGLVYRSEKPEASVILFADGTLAVVDAPSESATKEAIRKIIEVICSLGLVDDLPDEVSVHTSATTADPSTPSINED